MNYHEVYHHGVLYLQKFHFMEPLETYLYNVYLGCHENDGNGGVSQIFDFGPQLYPLDLDSEEVAYAHLLQTSSG